LASAAFCSGVNGDSTLFGPMGPGGSASIFRGGATEAENEEDVGLCGKAGAGAFAAGAPAAGTFDLVAGTADFAWWGTGHLP
jgi:hypothetical protein